MKAQVLTGVSPIENKPLHFVDLPVPEPLSGEIRVQISVCGICHTELDEIEGRLKCELPVVPGHQIIGRVDALGKGAGRFRVGDRVGIAWINSTDGTCSFCWGGQENLCPEFKGTGCDANGGYADYTVVLEDFAYAIPDRFSDAQAAPLLCAGAVGYRALTLSLVQPGQTLGLFGFGSSGHLVLQAANYMGIKVFAFTRGEEHRRLALTLGAAWAGMTDPPHKINAAIDFTPVGETVPRALEVLDKGGRLVLAVIRKRDPIPALDYARLWDEREIKSVSNVTRLDVDDFLSLAAAIPILPEVREFKLSEANEALLLLKQGKMRGSAVLKIA